MFLPSISKIGENIILLKIFIVLNQSCSVTYVEQKKWFMLILFFFTLCERKLVVVPPLQTNLLVNREHN